MIIYNTNLSAISKILLVSVANLSALAFAFFLAEDWVNIYNTNLSAISEILLVSSANLSALALASSVVEDWVIIYNTNLFPCDLWDPPGLLREPLRPGVCLLYGGGLSNHLQN